MNDEAPQLAVEKPVDMTALVRRIDAAMARMSVSNPNRRLLEDCKRTIVSLALNLSATVDALDDAVAPVSDSVIVPATDAERSALAL